MPAKKTSKQRKEYDRAWKLFLARKNSSDDSESQDEKTYNVDWPDDIDMALTEDERDDLDLLKISEKGG